jgi:hypothetical protein
VPDSTPVDATKVTPAGSAPDSLSVGAGNPDAVTWNVAAWPAVKVACDAEVTRAAWFTLSVNDCVTGPPTPFEAVNVSGWLPPVLAAGVPDKTPVAALNVTPAGRVPDSESVGTGDPEAVTVKVAVWPTVNVVDAAEVNAGAVELPRTFGERYAVVASTDSASVYKRARL